MTVAVVAEKPSVARDIAAVLGARQSSKGALRGEGYVVSWAIGHLVGLAQPHEMDPGWKPWRAERLPMLPKDWLLKIHEQTRDHFEELRQILADPSVERIVCATDAGREGELIFRYIYRMAGCTRPVERLWISSLTPQAIRDGFKNLRPSRDFDALAAAAEGRSRADWLVGMNLSRAYTLRYGADDLFSVGRVQTPTLAMIVDREKAIASFVPEVYFEVRATFGRGADGYDGVWFDPARTKDEEGEKRLAQRLPADGDLARAICARCEGGEGALVSLTGTDKSQPPPLLYDLTELQRHANRLFGLTAKDTLAVAQALYEKHKLLSYPRTDSRHLSASVAGELAPVLQAIAGRYPGALAPGTGQAPLSRRYVDDAKVSDHHALIPTNVSRAGKDLSRDEERIYDLVCRRLLMAWHGDHKTRVTHAVTEVRSASAVDAFRSSGTVVTQAGWKVLDVEPARDKAKEKEKAKGKSKDTAAGKNDGGAGAGADDDREADRKLPDGLAAGQRRPVTAIEAERKQTSPPRRFTDASLLTAMETAGKSLDSRELEEAMRERGLGTPATRAAILETLLQRAYVERKGRSLYATPKGIALVDVVHEAVKSPSMTGEWELALKRMEQGEGNLPDFMRRIEAYVVDVVRQVFGGGGSQPSTRAARPGAPALAPAATAASGAPAAPPQSSAPAPARVAASAAARSEASAGGRGEALTSSPSPEAREPAAALAFPTTSGSSIPADRARNTAINRANPSHNGVAAHGADGARQLGLPLGAPPAPSATSASAAAAPAPSPAGAPRHAPTPVAELGTLLQSRFGFDAFRPHQEEVCRAVSSGENALLVMPTGSGKSLCYQLPGIARGGTTLVISPLIALMEDQTAKLQAMGFAADRVHSGRTREQSRAACRAYLDGALDFLTIAPERLSVPGFPEMLAKRPPALIAVDEAHCISHWGHDFRPDYRLLGDRLPLLKPAPVIALTATATTRVQKDILEQLAMPQARRFIRGFRRDNLALEAVERPRAERLADVLATLTPDERRPAVVYVPTRKMAEEVANALGERWPCAAYHAGLATNARNTTQEAFLAGKLEVVVATIAFGMGIDKADIRTVMHMALPSTLEGYYQEIGRAGRDGKPARAVLLYSYGDRKVHESFFERDYPDPSVLAQVRDAVPAEGIARQDLAKLLGMENEELEPAVDKLWIHGGITVDADDVVRPAAGRWRPSYEAIRTYRAAQLDEVLEFAQSSDCRMARLVRYFGERDARACGHCDACRPRACVGRRFRPAHPDELRAAEAIFAELQRYDGVSTGTLFRALCAGDNADRRAFERLLEVLSRSGFIALREDEFEKDGKVIRFRRAHLAPNAGRARLTAEALLFEDDGTGGAHAPASSAGAARAFGGGTPRPENSAAAQPPTRRRKGERDPKKKRSDRAAETERAGGGFDDGLGGEAETRGHGSFEQPDAKRVERLRAWRREVARSKGIPAFRILSDRTLYAIAEDGPATLAALGRISGIGPKILEKYGEAILKAVADG